MNTNITALDATAAFVIFGAIFFSLFSLARSALKIAKLVEPTGFLDYPFALAVILRAATIDLMSKYRLDEYSLGSGLVTFGVVAFTDLGPRPACAAMILMIAMFNTLRPAEKRVKDLA